MSFWRKLNKVIFVVSLVVFSLAVVVGAVIGFIAEWWIGLIVLVGGGILVPILFSTWGILLEFLDNVATAKRDIAAIRNALAGGNATAVSNTNTNSSTSTGGTTTNARSTANAPTAAPVMDESFDPTHWRCSKCGKKNENEAAFCYNCGNPKG